MRRLALALALALLAHPAQAAPPTQEAVAAVRGVLADDARLQTIGWRLARANAPFCARVGPSPGLALLDVRTFLRPALVRWALGGRGEIFVGGVAAGSPAAAAGLRGGEEVIAIGGRAMAQVTRRDRLDLLHGALVVALAQGGVGLDVAPHGGPARSATLQGLPACRGRFVLRTLGASADADDERVTVASALLREHPDDAEAAALIAHELAHIVLGHWTPGQGGRNSRAIRRTEREADRLAPWLMANAGYDPAAALRFIARWGENHDPGLTRPPTHDGWRDRSATIEREVAAIRAELARGRRAPFDWRERNFSANP